MPSNPSNITSSSSGPVKLPELPVLVVGKVSQSQNTGGIMDLKNDFDQWITPKFVPKIEKKMTKKENSTSTDTGRSREGSVTSKDSDNGDISDSQKLQNSKPRRSSLLRQELAGDVADTESTSNVGVKIERSRRSSLMGREFNFDTFAAKLPDALKDSMNDQHLPYTSTSRRPSKDLSDQLKGLTDSGNVVRRPSKDLSELKGLTDSGNVVRSRRPSATYEQLPPEITGEDSSVMIRMLKEELAKERLSASNTETCSLSSRLGRGESVSPAQKPPPSDDFELSRKARRASMQVEHKQLVQDAMKAIEKTEKTKKEHKKVDAEVLPTILAENSNVASTGGTALLAETFHWKAVDRNSHVEIKKLDTHHIQRLSNEIPLFAEHKDVLNKIDIFFKFQELPMGTIVQAQYAKLTDIHWLLDGKCQVMKEYPFIVEKANGKTVCHAYNPGTALLGSQKLQTIKKTLKIIGPGSFFPNLDKLELIKKYSYVDHYSNQAQKNPFTVICKTNCMIASIPITVFLERCSPAILNAMIHNPSVTDGSDVISIEEMEAHV